MGIKIRQNSFCWHTRALFSKVYGQVHIFLGNGQTWQEHISKDEAIRHYAMLFGWSRLSELLSDFVTVLSTEAG
jgi:hypothetical protein